LDGLLLIDKPAGMTSHDVVARARRLSGMRQIGHAGTLDPLATGLLVLCLGHAVRLSEYLTGKDKAYLGRVKLGERTATDDAEGEVVERRPVALAPGALDRAAAAFTGDLMQAPPQYSAIQVEGRRAYHMARHGESVALAPRPVRIARLELQPAPAEDGRPSADLVDLRVTCSAGTYVRALARDIGEWLGCGAHLAALRRVRSGAFRVEDALALSALPGPSAPEWPALLLPMDRAVEDMPRCDLDADAARRLLLGQFISLGHPPVPARDDGLCRVYGPGGAFIALGRFDRASAQLKPAKVFQQPAA
jgi:tRNA pseudouridine55 synthase